MWWCSEDLTVQTCGPNGEGKFYSGSDLKGGWTTISAKVNPKRIFDGCKVFIDIASSSEGKKSASFLKAIQLFQDFNPVDDIGTVQRWFNNDENW